MTDRSSGASGYPKELFTDWSETTLVPQVPTVVASDAGDVARLCNLAAAQGMKVRALGHHHNWSPLILRPGTPPNPNVLLVETTNLKGGNNPKQAGGLLQATFGAGTTLEDATAYLEKHGNGGVSPAPGYSFLNMPTPGKLSLGGILAIGGHGTSVPVAGSSEPALMGCLSNLIVSFKAVTTDPKDPTSEYAIREFDRTHPDAPAFLVHLGRAFITEVTLAAVPNYYLQLHNMFPPMTELMAPPDSQLTGTLSSLLGRFGRVEAIWFPYANEAWVQCMERLVQKPDKPVTGPYNYQWMKVPWLASEAIKLALHEAPWLIKAGSKIEEFWVKANETGSIAGTARDLEIYLMDDTLRMGIMGYALQLPRHEVQRVAFEFYQFFTTRLKEYNQNNLWPVNGAVEIRCTTLDDPTDLGLGPAARPPALSVTHGLNPADTGADIVVLWLDVLSFPNSPNSAEFFTDLEKWMIKTWDARYPNRVRPEWSKGWAYTKNGPWTDKDLISRWVPQIYDAATDTLTFSWAKKTLAAYDRSNIFTNDWLSLLFG